MNWGFVAENKTDDTRLAAQEKANRFSSQVCYQCRKRQTLDDEKQHQQHRHNLFPSLDQKHEEGAGPNRSRRPAIRLHRPQNGGFRTERAKEGDATALSSGPDSVWTKKQRGYFIWGLIQDSRSLDHFWSEGKLRFKTDQMCYFQLDAIGEYDRMLTGNVMEPFWNVGPHQVAHIGNLDLLVFN